MDYDTSKLAAIREQIGQSNERLTKYLNESDKTPDAEYNKRLDTYMIELRGYAEELKLHSDEIRVRPLQPSDLTVLENIRDLLMQLNRSIRSWVDVGAKVKGIEELRKKVERYTNLPTSSLTNTAKKIFNNPSRIGSTRQGQIKKTVNFLTKDSIITYKGNGSELTFTLERTRELFTKRIQNGAKILNFLLQKLNEQHYQERTHFQMSEVVDLGIYANSKSGYKGLIGVTDKFMSTYIEGIVTVYDGSKKREVSNTKAALVSERKITANDCYISFPPILRESMAHITILPNWSYALNENSFMLLDYIFYLARQNTKQIKEKGHFNISLETIRMHLGLPTIEEAGDDPKRLIFEPIEKAITEIEDGRKGTDIKITPCYDHDYKHISEYLAGHLQVELDETAQNYMEQRAIAQEGEIKKQQKRIEKAKQKAAEKEAKK